MVDSVLVDSNVILDVLTADPVWLDWSVKQLDLARNEGRILIYPIICAEIAPVFEFDWSRLYEWLRPSRLILEGLPFESSTIAAAAFKEYRTRGGSRTSPLPDFYIGAHAEKMRYRLLTRDRSRYETYFPGVNLIAPDPGAGT